MPTINLKVNDLRKQKGISQQVLAEALGVAFQTISKWENNTTMPDITMLPAIAEYFEVSVDQILGLKPLPDQEYIPVLTGTKEYWSERLDYLIQTRRYMWNHDYMSFLVEKVWEIDKPVHVLDCGCGWGFLASFLMPLLPEGSRYTGLDLSEKLIEEAKKLHEVENVGFLCEDFIEYKLDQKYDMVICQAVLRHIGKPNLFLDKMVAACKPDGIVVGIDVNREIESDGLYIEGMNYGYLCTRPGFQTMWNTELEKQDRDYAIGIRLPEMMIQSGLKNVECRMNDKVNFISTQRDDYRTAVYNLSETRGWGKDSSFDEKAVIEQFMNHGMMQSEAEAYCRKQREIKDYFMKNNDHLSIAVTGGLMISYGRK